MKKKGILGAIVIALLCTGCVHKLNAVTTKAENNFQLPNVKSDISQEKCCICGNNERSLMPYYRKSGMLGLVCLNTMEISTLDTRVYSDDGTEIISDGGLSITSSSHGEEECSFQINGMPNHGIFEGKVNYGEKSIPDFEVIKKYLCQDCLDKVLSMYQDEMEWSDSKGRFPEVCIVDFQTNELYTLGKSHTGYWIRDYWIHIDHDDDSSSIMAIYAPEDKMDSGSEESR